MLLIKPYWLDSVDKKLVEPTAQVTFLLIFLTRTRTPMAPNLEYTGQN
ncbi:Uncharacterised protein [Yersinia thracica]|uniref:Uncharacterized protein n=1 Tax=Yersinia thracica TaxID=2890319 RepID=A0A0T9NQF8_9GAMM|nr:Uncharacterised protein [Yersinia thracica]